MAERALAQNRRFAVVLRVLAVALVKIGQQDRAAQAVQELPRIEQALTISTFFTRIPVPVEGIARAYSEALKAAGVISSGALGAASTGGERPGSAIAL